MQIITGAAGFIGSCLLSYLNRKEITDIVLVDDFSVKEKKPNYSTHKYQECIPRDNFLAWFRNNANKIDLIYHIGARTDTSESDWSIFEELNLSYSKEIWKICSTHQIPLIYASSAATYGNGQFGYSDDHQIVSKLKPLNPYGKSKQLFDEWALNNEDHPPFWAGLKFFNVYGPNEYHKGRMASVIFHGYRQIQEKGFMKLFHSHNPDYEDGMQKRDFIYVKDVVKIIKHLADHKPKSGLYNVGTGQARSFFDLASSTFTALDKSTDIRFIDTPRDIRKNYQYFTEADMSKLRSEGKYTTLFTSLEDGIKDYITNFLLKDSYY